jgi:glycosyltransferase A (GT-A) superfamily protein (DUF2064 family)
VNDHAGTVVVLAKEPVPGRVKTRLQPAFSAYEAGRLAAAAITDTCAAVRDSAAGRRILAWEGDPPDWAGDWEVVEQPSGTLNERLLFALSSALAEPTAGPALLIGMDTPQVAGSLLDTDWEGADAVLGLSDDGGFWAIGLRRGFPSGVFEGVPMSTARTGAAQLARMLDYNLSVRLLPPLRDIDEAEDAEEIAYRFPALAFSRCYAELLAARSQQPPDRVFVALRTAG